MNKSLLLIILVYFSQLTWSNSNQTSIQKLDIEEFRKIIISRNTNPNFFFDQSTVSPTDPNTVYYRYHFKDTRLDPFSAPYPVTFVEYQAIVKNNDFEKFSIIRAFLDCKNKIELSIMDEYNAKGIYQRTTTMMGEFNEDLSPERIKRCSMA